MMLRVILAFIAAVAITNVAIACVNTAFVNAELVALGVDIPLARWLSGMVGDALGIAPTFLPVIGIGFAIAFLVAWAVVRWLLPGQDALGYPLAGLTCVLVVVMTVNQLFSTHPIPATRSLFGMLAVLACGGLGGWIFNVLRGAGGEDGSLQRSPA